MSVLSRIVIEQQYAQIGVRVTPAQLKITAQQPKMSIENDPPEMNIDWKAPSFEVNWKQVHNESGLKAPDSLKSALRDKSVAEVYNTIGTIASDGRYVGDLKNKGPRIAQIAKRDSQSIEPRGDTNLGLMPKSSPKIEWDPGYMHINWDNHRIKIEWEGEYMPEMVVDPPYSVEVYLRNKPYFRITVEDGEATPYSTSRLINEAV